MYSFNNVYSLIGMAYKARKVVSGELQIKQAVRNHIAQLVIVSEDSSLNTQKVYKNLCKYYHVELIFVGTKEQLGYSIGKNLRAALAVIDKGFADLIRKKLGLS
jgi:ribosomal protein L7Ae-like RNA K-turn-binding protein